MPMSPLEASTQVMGPPIFAPPCQMLVHPSDPICDIKHSIKIKYSYTKPYTSPHRTTESNTL